MLHCSLWEIPAALPGKFQLPYQGNSSCHTREIPVALPGKFQLPFRGTAAARTVLPIPISMCAVFSRVQIMVWLPLFGIFNVRTDVEACDCTRGLYGHREESLHWKVTGRKIPCRIGDWNQRQYCAWLFSWTLYQLSYSRPLCSP